MEGQERVCGVVQWALSAQSSFSTLENEQSLKNVSCSKKAKQRSVKCHAEKRKVKRNKCRGESPDI